MLVPPVATGAVDRDDESVGVSSRGRQVMSDRGRGQDFQQNAGGAGAQPGGQKDFKKAYLAVSVKFHDNKFAHCLMSRLLQLVEDLATKHAEGDVEGQIAVTEEELQQLNHQVSL